MEEPKTIFFMISDPLLSRSQPHGQSQYFYRDAQ